MDSLAKSNTKLISMLMHSRTQAHIFHFRTRSYSEHKAHEEYYLGIVALLDTYTETYQGQYGILDGYSSKGFEQDPGKALSYYNSLLTTVSKTLVPDKVLENLLQGIQEHISRTIYKLKNLK